MEFDVPKRFEIMGSQNTIARTFGGLFEITLGIWLIAKGFKETEHIPS